MVWERWILIGFLKSCACQVFEEKGWRCNVTDDFCCGARLRNEF